MAIVVSCDCGKRFEVRDEAVGQQTGCPACGRSLVVPKGHDATDDPMFAGAAATSGKAITSLVLGILSFVCNIFTGIPAIIFGAIGLSDIGQSRGRLGGKGMAITGMVLGAVGSLTLLVVPVMVALLLPAVQAAREAARRTQLTNNLKEVGLDLQNCTNNLKQIALALHNYHDANGQFPPAAIADASGKPLLSWRVAILPYLEEVGIYGQFKLDEPWDSPANRALLTRIPAAYLDPSDPPGVLGETHYEGIVGPGALFENPSGARIADVTDGTANTLMVVEAARAVPWTKPDDVGIAAIASALGSKHPGGTNAAFADGSVKFLKDTVSAETLKALATRNGGQGDGGSF